MASLEKLARPDLPEGRSTALSENQIPGWVPGIITGLDDPEKIGRIQVKCDLINSEQNLPNGQDGWCWVLEEFTCNSIAGGAHRLLKIGTQVAMLPMLGDPRQMILLGCLPSRVDRPSPELDRNQELYGSHTPGQVYRVRNDGDASEIDAYPHGVIHHIAAEGHVTTETRDGARLQLKADGSTRMENRQGSATISPDGTIEHRNTAKGSALLDKNGNWQIKSQNESALKLGQGDAVLEGPRSPLASLVNSISTKLSGPLGQAQGLLNRVNGLTNALKSGGSIEDLANALPAVLNSIKGTIDSFPQVLSSLNELQKFSVDDLGKSLIGQANSFLDSGLGDAVGIIKNALKGKSVEDALATIARSLPQQLADKLDINYLTPVLKGLSHSADSQEQAVLEQLAGGLEPIQNIVGLGLHGTLAETQQVFSSLQFPAWIDAGVLTPEITTQLLGSTNPLQSTTIPTWIKADNVPVGTEAQAVTQFQDFLQQQAQKLNSLLPSNLQSLFKDEDIQGLIQTALTGGDPMQALLGHSALKLANDLAPTLLQGVSLGGAIAPMQKLIGLANGSGDGIVDALSSLGIKNVDLNDMTPEKVGAIAQQVLPDALSSLTSGLGGLFGNASKKTNALSNALNGNAKGGIVRATGSYVEAAADAIAPGARLLITQPKAALQSIGGVSEVFATGTHAGVSTPHGSFGIGAGGGSLITQGLMAMRVAQDIGKSAGMVLNPHSGVSLASFQSSDFHNDATQWLGKTAEITVDEGIVFLQSHLGDGSNVSITPSGVFIEGLRVSQYLYDFENRFTLLESRLAQLIPVTPSTTPR